MAGPTKHPVSFNPQLTISIADGPDIGRQFTRFEWASFTNGGYIIRATLEDPYWNILKDFATEGYLARGRKEPTPVRWKIEWPEVDDTGLHLGYMTASTARGIQAGGSVEFIAVDPPSFWLNAGDSSGAAFTGSVKTVIEQVIDKYYIGPNGGGDREVSETLDSVQNQWWMMRQDPKTFIQSLLEWSASVTEQKTNWIVSSSGAISDGEPTIWVKEQAKRESIPYGTYVVDTRAPAAQDMENFRFLADNFISVFQKQLITQGISAISGRFLDRRQDTPRQVVHVYDERTAAKKNVDIDPKKGFTKPGSWPDAVEQPHEWSTSVPMVPEFNAGDLGIGYDKYIDGRARARFLDMLNLTMRIKVRITGEPSKQLAISHNLGVSTIRLIWLDDDFEPYFLDGDWLVYGFHHVVTRGGWHTDLYCARLDHDAASQKVGG